MTSDDKPDVGHLAWALEQRAAIQSTLLALYEFIRANPPGSFDWVREYLLDHLIAAAFSLWRAVFLSESDRDLMSIYKGQEDFLASVLTNNAINFADDKRNRAWTVSYYLENAKHRLSAAHFLAEHHLKSPALEEVLPLLRLKGTSDVALTRYEWESVHSALRVLLKVLHPESKLSIVRPTLPS